MRTVILSQASGDNTAEVHTLERETKCWHSANARKRRALPLRSKYPLENCLVPHICLTRDQNEELTLKPKMEYLYLSKLVILTDTTCGETCFSNGVASYLSLAKSNISTLYPFHMTSNVNTSKLAKIKHQSPDHRMPLSELPGEERGVFD